MLRRQDKIRLSMSEESWCCPTFPGHLTAGCAMFCQVFSRALQFHEASTIAILVCTEVKEKVQSYVHKLTEAWLTGKQHSCLPPKSEDPDFFHGSQSGIKTLNTEIFLDLSMHAIAHIKYFEEKKLHCLLRLIHIK